jgi:hypothetical protein
MNRPKYIELLLVNVQFCGTSPSEPPLVKFYPVNLRTVVALLPIPLCFSFSTLFLFIFCVLGAAFLLPGGALLLFSYAFPY